MSEYTFEYSFPAPDEPEPAPPPVGPPSAMEGDGSEDWQYLLEVVADYERYVGQIGNLGLTAPNVLYYRDEIQEMLDDLSQNSRVDTREVWAKIRGLDLLLRARQVDLVAEIGHANFKQYQIMNDPPRTRWWWFLNRVVAAPPPPPRPFWQFWKAPDKAPEGPVVDENSDEKFSL